MNPRRADRRGAPPIVPAGTPVGWILLEHLGSWPRARVDLAAVLPLQRAAAARGLRLNLIRRTEPERRADPDGTCYLAYSAGPRRFVERVALGSPGELSAAILDGLAAGRPLEAAAVIPEPIYLVCTDTRMDRLCSFRGRRVAAVLRDVAPGRVWATGHVGGCRFAANVVRLPDGRYFRQVSPHEAERIVSA
ncbi:sucrase ferredoxin [Paractinoplanes atraurantiacus]|uniref:Sucrase/ferredoxin-like n=1 Tax=Paractinoplanes atraurantiacus TaxID=1036182 RepID=A0A285GME1_9ACTN|nr:sucrase ferredoxin [Actinoplanes atraurantiacus]SNY24473.1 Sucrase/ferredoxin-like [Actinoplanes atraurantiacus]